MNAKDIESHLVPIAVYRKKQNDEIIEVRLTPGDGPHSTNGKTTGPSDYVINAGMKEDQDKSSDPADTNLGAMRAELTSLQDKINIFLTDEMKKNNGEEEDVDIEKIVADVESEDES